MSVLVATVSCWHPRHALTFPPLPPPSPERLSASLADQPFDLATTISRDAAEASEKGKTVLYLAYGSNLCKETFLGKRGVKPLSQLNVLVPELRLTFDLPGIPYWEPCFANTARRDAKNPPYPTPTASIADPADLEKQPLAPGSDTTDYHKDRWKKGLVGVVYEVTPSDYVHIIATEGGGASYQDILVTCYPLAASPTVPESPDTPPFRAHTLFAPAREEPADKSMEKVQTTGRFQRPNPSYAQPSSRYLHLITTGASECALPSEYSAYLSSIRPYAITSQRQQLGKLIFLAIWMPFVTLIFALQARFQDDKGRSPDWLVRVSDVLFAGIWGSYDGLFRTLFGDGERTIGME
ncbi:gliotoxin biosynthesis protein GliK [Lepidopterella palustris CBS 459.81]|uniref:gamma-glutamylcyclotransferase n=1 Tax=Lepidopterella palustris CBS 459.81 TaxID=1314670 RepID=A0A8E2E811_9PEZI|nr:gliotoxin biosynthesis protein GliK [Lepidopterella palustris CBS 459.81]